MTTTSTSRPINSSEATFSYAAAASGKNSTSSTTSTNKSQTSGLNKLTTTTTTPSSSTTGTSVSSTSSTAQNMNGSTAPTTGASTPQSLPAPTADLHPKTNGDANPTVIPPAVPSPSLGVGSTPTLPKEDELTASVSSVSEDKGSSSWEKQSQASSHTENKTSSVGSRTPDVSKGSDLVPAAPPAVNFWEIRKSENLTAKKPSPPAAAQTTAKTTASPGNATVAKDNAEKPAEPRQADKRKKPLSENQDVSEKEKPKEGSSGVKDVSTREFRDRKKSTDAGRVNGPINKEDGGALRKLTRKQQSEKETATPVLPPPVTDTESWPTPEIAQDEVGKAKRDKDEKDKTASSGALRTGQKWVSVTIDAPYVPPFSTKSGRGRGAHNGRDGGRGGLRAVPSSSSNGERHSGIGFGAEGAEGDRNRQGPNPGASRAGYQGNKNGKRATSPGGTAQRRESKGTLAIPPPDKKKDLTAAPEAGEPTTEPARSTKTASTGTQTHGGARRGSRVDDSNFVAQGDGRQFSENQDRGHQNGNGNYHPRSDRGYNQGFNRSDHHGADTASTHTHRERGYEGGRGRGRGRGNYHNQSYSNGHNGGHHHNPGPHYNSTPPHFNAHHTNGQHPAQTPRSSQRGFRGGSGSHQGANNQNYNRYPNPNMQPPPPPIFMPAYPIPYDFSMISPTGIPLPIEFPGILEIIAQVNYYFSVDNLCKDMFLRKHMDNDGYVRLSLIAGFARMRQLTIDINLLREACLRSQEVQIAAGVDDFHLRKAVGWETWVLSEGERDPSAQCDQSSWQVDPRQRNPQNNSSGSPLEMSGSATPFMPGPTTRGQYQNTIAPGAPPFVPSGVFPPAFSATPLSANVPEFSPNALPFINGTGEHSSPIQDEFFPEDTQRLVVVTKRPGHTSPLASPTRSRTNGVLANGTSAPTSPNRPSFGSNSEVGWLLKDENQTLESETYIHRLYPHALAQAQRQRETSGPTKNPEMATLYKFWPHFLCAKFNSLMYNDFRKYAFLDADLSHRFGLECVYKFYEDGLMNREQFHDSLIQDLVLLVKKDAKNGKELGPERLKSLLANPQLSTERKQKIEDLLDSEIQTVLQNGVEAKDGLVEPYTT